MTKRTAKIAARGKDDTGRLAGIVEEGEFLESGEEHGKKWTMDNG